MNTDPLFYHKFNNRTSFLRTSGNIDHEFARGVPADELRLRLGHAVGTEGILLEDLHLECA
jgi:hypothetical protein